MTNIWHGSVSRLIVLSCRRFVRRDDVVRDCCSTSAGFPKILEVRAHGYAAVLIHLEYLLHVLSSERVLASLIYRPERDHKKVSSYAGIITT